MSQGRTKEAAGLWPGSPDGGLYNVRRIHLPFLFTQLIMQLVTQLYIVDCPSTTYTRSEGDLVTLSVGWRLVRGLRIGYDFRESPC